MLRTLKIPKKVVIVVPEDDLALPDRSNLKFMEELKQMKEHSNRLTGKVGENNLENQI